MLRDLLQRILQFLLLLRRTLKVSFLLSLRILRRIL